MDIEIQTNGTKVEIPHRQTVQHREEKVLGEISIVSDEKKDFRPNPFKQGDIVYFTAFIQGKPDVLYVVQAEVTKVPDGDTIKAYRVRITAVADRAIGGKPSTEQKALIGRAMNKRSREMCKQLGPIMLPKVWLN